MTIPKHDEIRLPALKLLSEHEQLKRKDFERPLAAHFQLSEDEILQEYESGKGKIFLDRISWALSYMSMAGLVVRPKRGVYQISDTGLKQLGVATSKSLDSYIEQHRKSKSSETVKEASVPRSESSKTPEEELYQSYAQIRQAVYDDMLDTILSKSPFAFEKLVVQLLQRMGYGDRVESAGEVTQASNDKGIDGIIKEDVLGLGRIYIQAKRYARNNNVGREDIQKFVGALAVAQSSKGVFITTSDYTKGAREYAESLNGSTTLVLINGEQLASYMYDYGLGVQTVRTLELKKLDGDFWDYMDDDPGIRQ